MPDLNLFIACLAVAAFAGFAIGYVLGGSERVL